MRGIGRAGYGSVEVDGLTGIIEKSKEAYLEVSLNLDFTMYRRYPEGLTLIMR